MAKILKIENGQIRSVFEEKSKKIFYSIVDSVGIASESSNPRNYWKVLKNRLKKSQNKLVTECNQLKMKSGDGKFYLTDSAEASVIVKIIELISPDYIPYFWRYFDNDSQSMSKSAPLISPSTINTKNIIFKPDPSYPQLNKEESKNFEQNTEQFSLLVDAYCTHNRIITKAFPAGVDVKHISIRPNSSSITISGTRSCSTQKNYSIKELSWGKFSRTLSLPQEVKENEIEIKENNEDGLLTIKLPLLNKNLNQKIIRMRTI